MLNLEKSSLPTHFLFKAADYPELYELIKRTHAEVDALAEQANFLIKRVEQMHQKAQEVSKGKWEAIHAKTVELGFLPPGTSAYDYGYSVDSESDALAVYVSKKGSGNPMEMLKRLLDR